MNEKKCDFFTNIANTLAVTTGGVFAAFYAELLKENPHKILEISALVTSIILSILTLTTYLFAYQFVKMLR
jgi:hypothetical protein